ncbi:Clp protease N-terminal domain-containing protein [Bacillus sp. N9]
MESILGKSDSLLTNLYERVGVTHSRLQLELDRLINKQPEVTGDGIKGGQYINSELQHVMQKAEQVKVDFTDEYLSVEHFILALMELKNNELSLFLQRQGVTKQNLQAEIEQMREDSVWYHKIQRRRMRR